MKDGSSKKQLIEDIKQGLADGQISQADLRALVSDKQSSKSQSDGKKFQSTALGAVLYVVGAVIVCSGIAVMIVQNWSDLNTFSRILFTLGLGAVVLAVAAYLRLKKQVDELLGETLLAISGVALGIGYGVVVNETGFDTSEASTVALIALFFGLTYCVIYGVLRSAVTAFLVFVALAVFIYSSAAAIQESTGGSDETIMIYSLMLIGAIWVAAGIKSRSRAVLGRISSLLNVFGALMFLGGSFWMTTRTDYDGDANAAWLLIFPLILAAVGWLSVQVRSRGLLLVASMFLTFFIFYVSGKYFSEVLGWPISLMLSGLSIIAIAYMVRKVNQRYISV